MLRSSLACLAFAASGLLTLLAFQNSEPHYQLVNRKILSTNAGRVDWSAANNVIAYDRPIANGIYNVWTINPDGSGDTCLTCNSTALPGLNAGNPVWSSDGKFILFQAQQPPSLGYEGNLRDRPGSGWNNDLWAMDSAGKKFWQLTHVPPVTGGVIHPQFSRTGNQVTWGQRLQVTPSPWGTWELVVGTFAVSAGGVPAITGIKTYTPGTNKYYYEPHGFSADLKTVFFMGNLEPGQDLWGFDNYSFNLATGRLKNLTATMNQWEEFPTPMPNTNKLIYMSTEGNAWTRRHLLCDLWMMNADGSGRERLTFYNDPRSSDNIPEGVCLADPEWNADGSRLVVYDNLGRGPRFPGQLWLFDVKPAARR